MALATNLAEAISMNLLQNSVQGCGSGELHGYVLTTPYLAHSKAEITIKLAYFLFI
jgi:hypothetical protein